MRFLSKLYAKFFGYFWMPCPSCGEMFGGHEVPSFDQNVAQTIPSGKPGISLCICQKCVDSGKGVPRFWNEK